MGFFRVKQALPKLKRRIHGFFLGALAGSLLLHVTLVVLLFETRPVWKPLSVTGQPPDLVWIEDWPKRSRDEVDSTSEPRSDGHSERAGSTEATAPEQRANQREPKSRTAHGPKRSDQNAPSQPENSGPRESAPSGPLLKLRGGPTQDFGPSRLGGSPEQRAQSVRRVPEPAPARARRGWTRSKIIRGYRFEREADGLLTYRDPSKDFIAVLRKDGSVEFESRAAAGVGVCAAGLCVTAGGLRKKGEKKRKAMNRVRVRFAPVPLGIGGQFGSTRGIAQKQLALLDATFSLRLAMRFERELQRIWRELPRAKARERIMRRAQELLKDAVVQDGKSELCEVLLAFIGQERKGDTRGGFRVQDLELVAGYCD